MPPSKDLDNRTCFDCAQTFYDSSTYARHYNNYHSPTKVYHQCQFCDYKAARRYNLQRHVDKQHEAELAEQQLQVEHNNSTE